MEDMNNTNKATGKVVTAAIVTAVLGLVVGFAIAKAMGGDKAETKMTKDTTATAGTPDTATKSADLRVVLNALEREHVDLASQATRNGFDGRADFDASAKALDANSVNISKAIGSVYGAPAEAKFLEIWRSHITFFVNYTVAAQKGDKAGMDKAVTDLGGYIDAISDFLSGANPNLPRDAVKQLVTDHVGLLKGAVDTYGAKDYPGSYAKEHAANDQIGKIADAIAGAIVKQYPEKF